MNNKKALFFLPLILVLGVCALLFSGLQQDPHKIASALLGKPVPEFSLPDVRNPARALNNQALPKRAYLLNVWGSWCTYCREEMPLLQELAKTLPIVGLNYRDKRQSAVDFLQKFGDPFVFSLDDSQGKLALALGVDGAPETYLIDAYGVIRHRYSGVLTPQVWAQQFLPLLEAQP